MSRPRIARTAADLAMTILLPLLMAYSLVGEAAHEWMGVAMVCCALFHNLLNRKWYCALFRGHYSPARVVNTLVNFLVLADILAMAVSGVLLSEHVFSFLNIAHGSAAARVVHLLGAYWGFLLLSFHLGLHIRAVQSRLFRRETNAKVKFLTRASVFLITCYGIFAFWKRHFPDYLLLRTQFVFWDYDEPLVFYLLDMAAVMVLFAALGYCLAGALSKRGRASAE